MSWIGFDIETGGSKPEYALQPWRADFCESWIRTSVESTAADNIVHVYDTQDKEGMRQELTSMVKRWVAEGHTVCAWNAAFEISWLAAYVPVYVLRKVKWLDGMLLWRHLENAPEYEVAADKRRSFGLKAAVAEFLPQYAGYDAVIDFEHSDIISLSHYNACDSRFTRAITKHLYDKLNEIPQRLRAALIESHSLFDIAYANYSGVDISRDALSALRTKLDDDIASRLAELQQHGATDKILASPTQLGKLLFGDWGLTPIKHGKTGASTDKETLHELSLIDSRVNDIREYREAKNNRTKFADNILEAVNYNSDGRAHPLARVFGTYSGRLTYSSSQGRGKDKRQIGWAVHQMKRTADFRNLVVAPEGYSIVEFDAAGQEFRWMAILSGDETMLELCQPGEDAHAYMGASIAGVDYRDMMVRVQQGDPTAKSSRQLGKVANLCMAAGTKVITDRGVCNIEDVRYSDLVWDGLEFVSHDGVVCSGFKQVITYGGITATPEHKVLVNNQWVEVRDAARHSWKIEPALGAGQQSKCRAAVRLVGGVIRRAIREVGSSLHDSTLRLWCCKGCEPAFCRDGQVNTMQSMCCAAEARSRGQTNRDKPCGQETAKACERLVSEMRKPKVSIVSKLRWAWNRMQVFFDKGGCRVGQDEPAPRDLCRFGHRQNRQRWSLRAWKLALGYAPAESSQQSEAWVYDIVNCGPRSRFAANGVIVHNSLQYRTSANKLLSVARTQYGMDMDARMAQRIHRTYQATYKFVPRFWDSQIRHIMRYLHVDTLAGRRVSVSRRMVATAEWSVQSTSINYPVQGTGADQKYLAMSLLRDVIYRHGARFLIDLHDGLYFLVPDNAVEAFTHQVRRILDNLPYAKAWGFTPPIPLPFDCKVGKTWGSLKEVKE